jgi:putative ABC transport system permease protein
VNVYVMLARVTGLFRKNRIEREIAEDIQAHLEMAAEENRRKGMSPEEADRAARRSFGGIEQMKEELRDQRGVSFVSDAARDLRYAWRSALRNPGFASLAILIMALGIGANTAVFSVVNAVLLKPLPYRAPDRIVTLERSLLKEEPAGSLSRQLSIPDFRDWRAQSSSFDAMAYYAGPREVPVTIGSAAEYARTTRVSGDFFRVFGVQPFAGHAFTDDEMKLGGGALLISYAYWQNHFAGDPAVIGRVVRMYGQAIPIAGVLPSEFRFPNNTDLWYPTTMVREPSENRGTNNYLAVGSLKPGVSLDQSRSEMNLIGTRLEQEYPETHSGRSVSVTPIREALVGDTRLTLLLLFGAVSVVLLIACANTATLLLGRATARTREVAVRAALGAGRRRIVRQLITESFLLALMGGAAGLLLAYVGSKAFMALAPIDLPRLTEGGIDGWVLAFTLGVSMVTSVIFGLVPALHASKVDLNTVLKQGGTRAVIGGGMARTRAALVVAEIAFAVVLQSGAGLLIKSFAMLQKTPLGFSPENVLLMRATGQGSVRDNNLFFRDMLARISTVPGVAAAGATMTPPGYVDSAGPYFVDSLPAPLDPLAPSAVRAVVTPGLFAAIGIPLKQGRDFNDGDIVNRPLVAIVNEALVRTSFAGRDPIGRTVFCTFDSMAGMTIIGVVGDTRQRGPAREPEPACYMPYRQHSYNEATMSIAVRTAENPTALTEALRRMARERAPDVPVTFTTLEARMSETVAAPRFRTWLFGVFAGLAVCLAMAGVYGVMAFAVGQRTNEIGLRIALGASRGSVLGLVLRQGFVLAGIGLGLGLIAAIGGTQLLASLLYEVKPNDPWVYLGVAVLLGVVAAAASYVPARRAAGIDPLAALRQE